MTLDASTRAAVVAEVLTWYNANARDLPWRATDTTPWGVLVSEIMLQQTPVARVLGPWQEWLARWPTPAALAAEESSSAVAAWGRLGYPRRARRLWQAAVAITSTHGGEVPADPEVLRTLPGVGEYTAAAVAAFAYGRRTLVLDTNVRRVLTRIELGEALPATHLTAAERIRTEAWLPGEPATAARWNVAAMELGALVCRAASPDCNQCPVAEHCAWLAAGRPPYDGVRRSQAWHGTDRQCRGVLLAALRQRPYDQTDLLALWPDEAQSARCLAGLVRDGLAQVEGDLVRL